MKQAWLFPLILLAGCDGGEEADAEPVLGLAPPVSIDAPALLLASQQDVMDRLGPVDCLPPPSSDIYAGVEGALLCRYAPDKRIWLLNGEVERAVLPLVDDLRAYNLDLGAPDREFGAEQSWETQINGLPVKIIRFDDDFDPFVAVMRQHPE